MTKTQSHKRDIRAFLQTDVWTTEKLCQLLAHAESKLVYESCCCLIGVPTADHALQGVNRYYFLERHYRQARSTPGAYLVEHAYYELGDDDDQRRRIVRPIIRAELRRRERLNSTQSAAMCYSGNSLAQLVTSGSA